MTVTIDPPTGAVTKAAAAVAGAVAAAVALGAGHLAGAATRRTVSPVVAVGERVIHLVPVSIEQWAIRTFGSDDKLVLVVGVTAACLLLGTVLGVVARRRPRLAAAGFAVFAAVGFAASLDGRRPVLAAVFPPAVAAAAGVAVLTFLTRVVTEAPQEREKSANGSRRAFLGAAAGGLVLAAGLRTAGTMLRDRFSAAASRAALRLPLPRRPLPALPAGVQAPIAGMVPFVTPSADFYRVDTALVVPQVRAEDWRLTVRGLVDRPFSLDIDELLALPMVEADVTLTCVSNTVGGRLVGNARWLGVPLADLLERAGVQPSADQVVGRSVDGWTGGFPVAAVTDRTALVAVAMNGEPLPIEHGFPARLVVAGLYGYVSATKWLTEIELTRFDAFDQYWVRRGWADRAPIKTMTRIDTPASLARMPADRTAIGGVAWAQTRGIAAVEVRVDDGPWQQAELADVPGDDTWRQWWLPWDATPGRHRLTARATDGAGDLQTDTRAEPFPNGASGWHQILVTVG